MDDGPAAPRKIISMEKNWKKTKWRLRKRGTTGDFGAATPFLPQVDKEKLGQRAGLIYDISTPTKGCQTVPAVQRG